MKTLVVHDRAEVGERIVEIVAECCPDSEVSLCADGSSARTALSRDYFDLLILDLTLPMVEGGKDPGFVVAEGLLEELFTGVGLIAPGNTLGITRDVSALQAVRNTIGSHLMAVIEESESNPWQQQLSDRTLYVAKSFGNRDTALANTFNFDLLIITALDTELDAFVSDLTLSEVPAFDGLQTFSFVDGGGVPRRGACYAIGRAGQPSASSETQGLLCYVRPKLAIMVGFCGGVPDKVDLGDILLADSSIDWDYGKWKPGEVASRLYARPEPVVIRNSKTHRIARKIVSDGIKLEEEMRGGVARLSKGEIIKPAIRLVPFASGSAVIGDPNVVDSIKSLNDAVGGVDMESYGFYYACRYTHVAQPEFICVKSVADHCNVDKDDRLHEACCYSSAMVARDIIARFSF
nr:hypothetical protein [Sphingomonas melonis]